MCWFVGLIVMVVIYFVYVEDLFEDIGEFCCFGVIVEWFLVVFVYIILFKGGVIYVVIGGVFVWVG